jgi:protein-tyrosine-phosphatase
MPSRAPARRSPVDATKVRVLFLCTGNSGRSQIAQALLEQAGGGRVEVVSAGSRPKPLHPVAVRVMRGYGIDLAGRCSKSVTEFQGRRFDYVITLCDRVREVCPDFPGRPNAIHWSVPDPAAAGDRQAVTAAFATIAADLHERIGLLIGRILPTAA